MQINPQTHKAYRLFHNGILSLARAEEQGIRVDVPYIEAKILHLERKMKRLEQQFMETNFYKRWQHTAGNKVNINSNTQLAHHLYHTLKLKIPKETATGRGSTDADALEQLNIPELTALLEKDKLKKLKDVLEGFLTEQVDGVVHTSFNLHLVKTYRSSSNSPNMQNISKRDEESMKIVRSALYPRKGNQLLEVDFSGMEIKVSVCNNQDPVLLKYVQDPTTDMHSDMAKQLFIIKDFDKSNSEHAVLRQAAKNGFVFPEFYGDYYKNCAVGLACKWGQLPKGRWKAGQGIKLNGGTLGDHLIKNGIKSLDSFTTHVQKIEDAFWNTRFRVYKRWKDRIYAEYQKTGYVDSYTGFRFSGVMSKNDVTNYPIQSAAFHVLLHTFIELDKIMQEMGLETRLIGQIHDSLILDCTPSELGKVGEIIKSIVGGLQKVFPWIIVKMEVDSEICGVDKSWAEKEKYNL